MPSFLLRGKLLCQGFIVPFFGHKIELEGLRTAEESADAFPGKLLGSLRAGGMQWKRTVERAYGSGESTYYYQLERFVRDLQNGPSGSRWVPHVGDMHACRHMGGKPGLISLFWIGCLTLTLRAALP